MHLQGRTSTNLNCSTCRLKPPVRLTEDLSTGFWASVVWRWALSHLCCVRGWTQVFKGNTIFFLGNRLNRCWWREWGRKVWNWVKERPTSQGCRRTHSSMVCVTYWREPGATACSLNRSDTQAMLSDQTIYKITFKQDDYWHVSF